MVDFHFTFENLHRQYQTAIRSGYQFLTCQQYVELRNGGHLPDKCIINRIDIDFSVKKAERLSRLFHDLGISGTFFLRLHASEYNPFSFENYRIIKEIIQRGNEIGYHSEVIDESAIWNESPEMCLKRDIDILNRMFGISIAGVASHGGMTGLNNLDFWKARESKDFGLLYEAYDWFDDVFYVSDSEWVRWKCYDRGKRVADDNRSLGKHVLDAHPVIYCLIHSDTYFDRHFYE